MKALKRSLLPGLAVLALGIAGCTSDSGTDQTETMPPPTAGGPDHGAHAHPSEGPHHGDLVELGNEEYHAEVVHDAAVGTVTIYVLDGAAIEQVPIEATEITINAVHDRMPEQFLLTASPDVGDPDGMSSRFVSTDNKLAGHLDKEGANPRLVLKINGKSYRGLIAHDHDHGDHAHGEHDHDEHAQ